MWDLLYSIDALIFLVLWWRAYDEAKRQTEKEGETVSVIEEAAAGKFTRRGTIYMPKGVELDMVQEGNPLYTTAPPLPTASEEIIPGYSTDINIHSAHNIIRSAART